MGLGFNELVITRQIVLGNGQLWQAVGIILLPLLLKSLKR
jgi:hypothetical protein